MLYGNLILWYYDTVCKNVKMLILLHPEKYDCIIYEIKRDELL